MHSQRPSVADSEFALVQRSFDYLEIQLSGKRLNGKIYLPHAVFLFNTNYICITLKTHLKVAKDCGEVWTKSIGIYFLVKSTVQPLM